MLNLQLFAGPLVALTVTQWFGNNFPASGDVRGVLISAVAGDAVIARSLFGASLKAYSTTLLG
jgi:hypothetical protein